LEWQRINKELEASPTAGQIDKELEDMIVDRLIPKYERQWALDSVRNRVTFLSVAIALSSSFLFYPLNLLVGIPLAIPLLRGLLEYIKLQGVSQKSLDNAKHVLIALYIIAIVLAGIIGALLLTGSGVTTFGRFIGIALIISSVIALVFTRRILRRINVLLRKQFSD